MEFDPVHLSEDQIYRFMVSAIVPRPIAWISTIDRQGNTNLAPFSYFMGVCCRPMTVLFCPVVGPEGRPKKDTLLNIEAVPQFVINVAQGKTIDAVNLSAAPFPPDESEFDHSGMTPVPSTKIQPPRVREASVAFECELREVIEINDGPGGGWLVLGTVLCIHAHSDLLDMTTLKVDLDALEPIARLGGEDFLRATDVFSLPRHLTVPARLPGVKSRVIAEEFEETRQAPSNDPCAKTTATTTDYVETRLLEWVRANAQDASDQAIDRDTPLLGVDSRLDSLAFVSLLALTEELLGRELDPEDHSEIARFSSVSSIVNHYFVTSNGSLEPALARKSPLLSGKTQLADDFTYGTPTETEVSEITRALKNWYEVAGVRSDPRRVLSDERREGAFYWPPHLAPLFSHGAVVARGPQSGEEILVRHLYQYLDFTANYELRVINQASELLANGRSGLYLPAPVRQDAYKIYVDEGYHALYSRDLIFQVAAASGIEHQPYDFDGFMEFMPRAQQQVPPELRLVVIFVIVVVFETLVTATLTQIPKQRNVISTVRELVTDHAQDEARHSVFYSELFGYLWGQLSPKQRRIIGPLLPEFIVRPLQPPREALRQWLVNIGIDGCDTDDIIDEAYPMAETEAGMARTARATVRLFGKHGLYDDPRTRETFDAYGLLPSDA